MNLPILNKKSTLVLISVAIILVTVSLILLLNRRDNVENPQLPAQVGQIDNLGIDSTAETPSRDTTQIQSGEDTSETPAEVVFNDPSTTENTAGELVFTPTDNSSTGCTDSATGGQIPCSADLGVITTAEPEDESDTGCGGEGQPACFDFDPVDSADPGCNPATGEGCSTTDPTCGTAAGPPCPDDTPEPECGTTTANPCPEEEPACGQPGAAPCPEDDPGIPGCFDANGTSVPCDEEEEPACGQPGAAPCPEEQPGCVDANGVPIECPDPNIPEFTPGCIDAFGNSVPCEEEDPGCVNAAGAPVPCEEEEPECDPAVENCGNTIDFCDPQKEICDDFIPECVGDSCNPPEEEQPPVVETPPVTQNPPKPQTQTTPTLKPSAPPKAQTNPPNLHKSGPGNIILLLTAPALAYLATKRRIK